MDIRDTSNNSANCEGTIRGRFLLKLPFNLCILRPHKSNRTFLYHRSRKWMKEYFGKALETNDEGRMTARRMGFEDGYLQCLKDLGIKLTYTKNEQLPSSHIKTEQK